MEVTSRKRKKIFPYIAILLIAAAAVGITAHYMKPKEVDPSVSRNMILFLDNQLSDIDLRMKSGIEEEDMASRLAWHKSNAKLFADVKNSKDPAVVAKRNLLRDKMIAIQKKDFPELRKAYVTSKAEALGQQQIQEQIAGPANDLVTFSGDFFAQKAARKQFLESIKETVHDLRFQKVTFRWASDKPEEHKTGAPGDEEI